MTFIEWFRTRGVWHLADIVCLAGAYLVMPTMTLWQYLAGVTLARIGRMLTEPTKS